jgi:hypothetical protein
MAGYGVGIAMAIALVVLWLSPDIDERSATLIRDPIVHIPHLSR